MMDCIVLINNSQPLLTFFFFLKNTPPPEISPLPLPAPLPISKPQPVFFQTSHRLSMANIFAKPFQKLVLLPRCKGTIATRKPRRRNLINRLLISRHTRSEEHTSELQSQSNLVCRLLLEKKKNI